MSTIEDAAKAFAKDMNDLRLKNETEEKTLNSLQGKKEGDIYITMLGTITAFEHVIDEGYHFHESHSGVFSNHCSATILLNSIATSLLALKANLLASHIVNAASEEIKEEIHSGDNHI